VFNRCARNGARSGPSSHSTKAVTDTFVGTGREKIGFAPPD
jgi:hypothetical protein